MDELPMVGFTDCIEKARDGVLMRPTLTDLRHHALDLLGIRHQPRI